MTRTACTSCDHETTVCPKCELGVLVEREGPHGRFVGCTEWRGDGSGCGYTQSLPSPTES